MQDTRRRMLDARNQIFGVDCFCLIFIVMEWHNGKCAMKNEQLAINNE